MTEFLSGQELITRLNDLSSKPNRKSISVAVAYIGTGHRKLITWKADDELIVALSEKNVRKGSVDPKVLIELINLGVTIYQKQSLHAKVFHFQDAVFVGSANLSDRAAGETDRDMSVQIEAGIFTNDSNVLTKVRRFLDDLRLDLKALTIEEIEPYLTWFKSDVKEATQLSPVTWILPIGTADSKSIRHAQQHRFTLNPTETDYLYISNPNDSLAYEKISDSHTVITIHKHTKMLNIPRTFTRKEKDSTVGVIGLKKDKTEISFERAAHIFDEFGVDPTDFKRIPSDKLEFLIRLEALFLSVP